MKVRELKDCLVRWDSRIWVVDCVRDDEVHLLACALRDSSRTVIAWKEMESAEVAWEEPLYKKGDIVIIIGDTEPWRRWVVWSTCDYVGFMNLCHLRGMIDPEERPGTGPCRPEYLRKVGELEQLAVEVAVADF